MNQELEIIRDQQQEVWNKFSAGWKKWDTLTMDFLKPVGDEMIRLLNPKNNDMVLDIAYWNLMTDIAAPVVAALSKADQAMKDKIKAEVYAAINQKYPDGNVIIDSSATVVYAQKK